MGIKKILRRQFIFVFFTAILLLSNGSIIDGLLDAEQDDSDGFWNDDFQNSEYVVLNNCEIVDGSVQLKNESTGHLYDFKSTIDRAAYSYPFWINYLSPIFLPPTTNLLFAEEFTPVSYSKIKNIDEDTSTTSGLVHRSSSPRTISRGATMRCSRRCTRPSMTPPKPNRTRSQARSVQRPLPWCSTRQPTSMKTS